jgi:hypothetical protein
MPVSQHLALPFLEAGQAQKHVTHNEALRMLDALVHLSVLEIASSPPGSPEDGARYIVGDPATDAFAEKESQIAVYEDGAWRFFLPRNGWLAYIEETQALLVYREDAWHPPAVTILQNLALLGVGTTADETNRFAAKLNKALWTARYVSESGDGDLRYTLNKEAGAHSLSLLMQSDWSGRAEIGLLGNDDLTMKVSHDGSTWREALVADRTSGAVSFPAGIAEPQTGLSAPLYVPNPAVGDIWRFDVSRPATPRTTAIAGASGTTITLSAAVAGPNGQWGRWAGLMAGRSRYRIWNMSKSPAQSAWVSDSPTTTTLTVTDAAHISGWSSGETIRLGDPNPTGANTLQMVALDRAVHADRARRGVPAEGVVSERLCLFVGRSLRDRFLGERGGRHRGGRQRAQQRRAEPDDRAGADGHAIADLQQQSPVRARVARRRDGSDDCLRARAGVLCLSRRLTISHSVPS